MRPHASASQRKSMRFMHHRCRTIFWWSSLLVLLMACQADPERQNRQTPIVVDAPVLSCEFSPSRRYVDTVIDTGTSYQDYRIYDVATGQQVAEDLLPPDRAYAPWIWLAGDIRFHMTRYQEPPPDPFALIPLNGWLVDIPNQQITDVLTLAPDEQAGIFAQVAAAFRQQTLEMEGGSVSPDGRFISNANIIWEYRDPALGRGTLLNSTQNGYAEGCLFGWKADSSGIYFVDLGGSRANPTGGPIRFLPVVPVN
jgi:hypothetical protein